MDVTNRRVQQKARFIACVVPFGKSWRTYARFLAIFDVSTVVSTRSTPRILDPVIFVLMTTTTEPITLSLCACARGNYNHMHMQSLTVKPEVSNLLDDDSYTTYDHNCSCCGNFCPQCKCRTTTSSLIASTFAL